MASEESAVHPLAAVGHELRDRHAGARDDDLLAVRDAAEQVRHRRPRVGRVVDGQSDRSDRLDRSDRHDRFDRFDRSVRSDTTRPKALHDPLEKSHARSFAARPSRHGPASVAASSRLAPVD